MYEEKTDVRDRHVVEQMQVLQTTVGAISNRMWHYDVLSSHMLSIWNQSRMLWISNEFAKNNSSRKDLDIVQIGESNYIRFKFLTFSGCTLNFPLPKFTHPVIGSHERTSVLTPNGDTQIINGLRYCFRNDMTMADLLKCKKIDEILDIDKYINSGIALGRHICDFKFNQTLYDKRKTTIPDDVIGTLLTIANSYEKENRLALSNLAKEELIRMGLNPPEGIVFATKNAERIKDSLVTAARTEEDSDYLASKFLKHLEKNYYSKVMKSYHGEMARFYISDTSAELQFNPVAKINDIKPISPQLSRGSSILPIFLRYGLPTQSYLGDHRRDFNDLAAVSNMNYKGIIEFGAKILAINPNKMQLLFDVTQVEQRYREPLRRLIYDRMSQVAFRSYDIHVNYDKYFYVLLSTIKTAESIRLIQTIFQSQRLTALTNSITMGQFLSYPYKWNNKVDVFWNIHIAASLKSRNSF